MKGPLLTPQNTLKKMFPAKAADDTWVRPHVDPLLSSISIRVQRLFNLTPTGRGNQASAQHILACQTVASLFVAMCSSPRVWKRLPTHVGLSTCPHVVPYCRMSSESSVSTCIGTFTYRLNHRPTTAWVSVGFSSRCRLRGKVRAAAP